MYSQAWSLSSDFCLPIPVPHSKLRSRPRPAPPPPDAHAHAITTIYVPSILVSHFLLSLALLLPLCASALTFLDSLCLHVCLCVTGDQDFSQEDPTLEPTLRSMCD